MPSRVRLPRGVVAPVLTGAVFYAAAAGALAVTRGADGIAAIWPANAILLAVLLVVPPREAWRHVALVALASMVANLGIGTTVVEAMGYTTANIAEVLVARRLIAGRDRGLPSLVTVPAVARFFIAAFVAALASATLATLFALPTAIQTWSSWVTTDLLGLLIVTPTIVTACTLARDRGLGRWRAAGEAALLLGLATALATAVFAQSTYPLLFLPAVVVVLGTLRLGPFGAAASVAVVAVVGSVFSFVGHGPLSPITHQGPAAFKVVFFQFYLLVLLGTGLPLAALLAARDALVRRLAESNRLLRLAERSAGLGHWWLSAGDEFGYCSPEAMRIHGLADQPATTLRQLLDAYRPADRARVLAVVEAARRDGADFAFEAEIVTPAGEQRRVHSTGGADRAADGTLIGLFGTLQDVTRQVQGQRALEEARTAAEHAARLATAAAETDALTGLANRRKIGALLDRAVAAARESGQPLSVAMFDLDHFKSVNDRFGHLVGDRVLCHVARVAAASLRGADQVGRIGGEEFVLLLPAAGVEQANAVGERVRRAIARPATDGVAALPTVTASLGIATLLPGEDAAALLHRADCALYEAKRAGRNQLRHAA